MNDNFKIFLDISKEDLNASKLLYDNKFYPQSLFYFQQSVEKSIKYLGIRDEIIDQKDLIQNINHKSSLILKKAMIKYQYLDLSNSDYDINNEFQELKDLINKTPEAKILDLILRNISDTLANENLQYDEIQTVEDFYQISKKINPDNPKLDDFKGDKNFNLLTQKKFQELKSDFIDYTKGVIILFYINIISERLVSLVRYPVPNNMTNPSEKYNNENSLIRELPNLHKALEYSLETIEIK